MDFLIGLIPWLFILGFVALIFFVIFTIRRFNTERRNELAKISAEITEIKEILKDR